jgi:uncharacterized protein YkwD
VWVALLLLMLASPFVGFRTAGAVQRLWATRANQSLQLEEAIWGEVNRQRALQGVQPLRWSEDLANVARARTNDMIARNYFSHDDPETGTSQLEVMMTNSEPFSQLFQAAGENLIRPSPFYLQYATEKMAVEVTARWMESPGHRRAMLRRDFTHTGIGIGVGRHGYVTITQIFGASKQQ